MSGQRLLRELNGSNLPAFCPEVDVVLLVREQVRRWGREHADERKRTRTRSLPRSRASAGVALPPTESACTATVAGRGGGVPVPPARHGGAAVALDRAGAAVALTRALLWSPFTALALLSSPLTMATDPVPVASHVAVPD